MHRIGNQPVSWRIRNLSAHPVTISTISATKTATGTTITATSEQTTLYEDDTNNKQGNYKITINDTNSETIKNGGTTEHPVQIPSNTSIGFDWNVTISNDIASNISSEPLSLSTISIGFKPLEKTAFAIYSEDDNSLNFYKRITIPSEGDTFNGKTVTNIYTGFETEQYICKQAGSNGTQYAKDAIINTPWYGRRLDILTVNVIDDTITPQHINYWFMNFNNCVSFHLNNLKTAHCTSLLRLFTNCEKAIDINISQWDVSHIETMLETFLNCRALESLNLENWDTSHNTCLHSTWNSCNNLSTIEFGNNWITEQVTFFSCVFTGTAFVKLDLSNWNFDNATELSACFSSMSHLKEINISTLAPTSNLIIKNEDTQDDVSLLSYDYSLQKITVGSKLIWDYIRDPTITDNITPISPSGKWYSMATGKSYLPADLSNNQADTYVSDKELLPYKSFAVYSDTDNSLNFYRQKLCDIPSSGDTYNDKTVTNVYFNFEENNPVIDVSSEHTYKYGYFHDLENKVISISVIDSGISPTSISGWFSDFRKLENVNGLQKIDMSRCTDAHYLFTFDSNLTRIDLSNWKCPVLNDIGGMFERCTNLEAADMSNLYAPKVNSIWFLFYNTKIPTIDMSSWTIGNIVIMNSAFAHNANLTDIKFPIGLSFKATAFATAVFDGCRR